MSYPLGPSFQPEWWPHSLKFVGKEIRHREAEGYQNQGSLHYDTCLPSVHSEQPLFPDAIVEGILPDPQMERRFSSPALVATSKSGVQLFLDLSGLPRESVGSEYFMGSC